MDLLIKNRRSGRTFDHSKMLTRDQISELLEAAAWAPSCYGDEPWRYLVCDKVEQFDSWKKALSCLVPSNQEWAKEAPLLLISCANTLFTRKQTPNRWGAHDTGAASISLCFQAVSMGLMAHQMGGFDEKSARILFSIPDTFIPMAVIAVGYEAAHSPDKETPRKRRPLKETFFASSWGISYFKE